GRSTLRHDELKQGEIGVRTGEVYGDPEMIGLEVREIHHPSFVDAIQKGLLTGRYGREPAAFDRWFATRDGAARVSDLHYNRPVRELVARAPTDLARALATPAGERLRADAERVPALKLLLYDWSADPVLAGQEGFARGLRERQ